MNNAMDVNNLRIGVVGAGSWGTALANLLALKGFKIDHWVFESAVKAQMESSGENRTFLPGISLSANLVPTNNIKAVVADKDLVLIVVPSHVMRATTELMAAHLHPDTLLVSASKGIENGTHLTMTGILAQTLPNIASRNLAVLTGPSFAREVARQVPTVVTAAAADLSVAECVQAVFATPYFRVYTSTDVIGAELGGAVKNIIAIAAGIIDGLGLGLNTRAALITRGLAEIRRLGLRLGAKFNTFAGPSGVGDLILTCTGDLSRNHTVGKKIGEGSTLKQILDEMHMVAEGVKTAKSVYNLSRELDVEMPISHGIYSILYDNLDPMDVLKQLMNRDLKHELDG